MRTPVPPDLVMLIAGTLMWTLHRWIPLGHWIFAPWQLLGLIPAVVGVAMVAAAIRRFSRAHTTVNPLDPTKASRLVTGGVFRLSRNPMYLGMLLILLGWAIALGSESPWLILPIFVVVITFFQIIPEEQALQSLFGTEYLPYRQRVARWIG